jgi:hypothetical protein
MASVSFPLGGSRALPKSTLVASSNRPASGERGSSGIAALAPTSAMAAAASRRVGAPDHALGVIRRCCRGQPQRGGVRQLSPQRRSQVENVVLRDITVLAVIPIPQHVPGGWWDSSCQPAR